MYYRGNPKFLINILATLGQTDEFLTNNHLDLTVTFRDSKEGSTGPSNTGVPIVADTKWFYTWTRKSRKIPYTRSQHVTVINFTEGFLWFMVLETFYEKEFIYILLTFTPSLFM